MTPIECMLCLQLLQSDATRWWPYADGRLPITIPLESKSRPVFHSSQDLSLTRRGVALCAHSLKAVRALDRLRALTCFSYYYLLFIYSMSAPTAGYLLLPRLSSKSSFHCGLSTWSCGARSRMPHRRRRRRLLPPRFAGPPVPAPLYPRPHRFALPARGRPGSYRRSAVGGGKRYTMTPFASAT